MSITKVVNDAIDLNQTNDYSGLRLPVGTTNQAGINFNLDYLIVAGGGGGGTAITASTIGTGGGGGAGGLRTSYNNTTTTTNLLSFPSGKTAVATYMLNGDATDVSGNYNGTESNISYNTGKYGGGAVFNGSNAYIDLPLSTSSLFDGKNTLAVSFWFKTTTTARQRMFTDYAQSSRNCDITIDGGNIEVVTDYGSTSDTYTSSLTYNNNIWHNIIVSLNQSANQRTIYIDGSLVDTITLPTDSWNGSGQKVTLGAFYSSSSGYSQYFDGLIDQLRIYNSALDSTNASNIYNNEVQAPSGGGSAAESSLSLTFGTPYTVTVGDGGVGGFSGSAIPTNGSNSVFSNITSIGGGAGGNYRNPTSSAYFAQVGGSGGGAAYTSSLQPGAAGTIGQGYQGGDDLGNSGAPAYGHGGGGGAAARGVNGGGSGSGAGGEGLTLSITGTATTFGGGGGGGGINPYPAGAGGSGGGGAGGYGNGNPGYPGAFNTGGGGGGAGKTSASGTYPGDGAEGGSGVVVLRYPTASVSSFSTTGTLNTPSTTDTIANNNYPTTNSAYYKLDGNANGPLTTTDLGTLDYPSGTGCIALYELNGNANGYLTTTDLSTVNYPAGAGCIALYELNGNTNDTSNTYNAGPFNITYDEGCFDQAAVFNGSSSYLDTALDLDTLTNYTISMWIKVDASPGSNMMFAGTINSSAKTGIYLSINTNNTIRFYERNSSTTVTSLESTDTINIGAWNHIVAVRDGGTNYIYINNGTPASLSNNSISHSVNLTIGRAGAYTTSYFDGEIDQVRLFNTGISASNVATLARGIATSYSGAESNITYGTGAFGKAAVFNGSSSKITVPDSSDNLNFSNHIGTISAWVNLNSLSAEPIVCKRGTGNPGARSYIFNVSTGGVINWYTYNTDSNAQQVSSTSTISANRWYHLAVTLDQTNIKIYIDGVLDKTASSTYTSIQDDGADFTIGYRGNNSGFVYADGSIDQVRIFNTALSATNIATLARGAGTSYNGAESNITWQNGRFNEAALFNGSSSKIDLPAILPTNSTADSSVSFWFKYNGGQSGTGTLFSSFGGSSSQPGYHLGLEAAYTYGGVNYPDGSLYLTGYFMGTGSGVNGTTSYADGQWHHVVVTYIFSTGVLSCFVDNASSATLSISYTSRPSTIGPFSQSGNIGYQAYGGPHRYAKCSIDQFRIFDSALTSSQVTDLYNEHYQTKFTDGSDTAIMFTQGTGNITFNAGASINSPQAGALRTNTDLSPGSANSGIEVYDGTQFKTFSATIS